MKNKINQYTMNYMSCAILYMLALINWLITITMTQVTNVTPNDFLGIVSRLPIYFFIAILLTIVAMKQAYDNGHMKIFAVGLFVMLVILFLTYPIIEPNASFSVSYYPSGMSMQILENGHMDTDFSYDGYVYLYYPSFQIFTSVIIAITDMNLDFIIKYFHILFIFIVVMFATVTYRLISKNWKFAITGSLLFIVFLWSEQLYYGPQLFALSLICILFFVLVRYTEDRNVSLAIIATLLFLSISSAHILGGLMIVSFLFIINMSTIISRSGARLKYFFIPFLVIYISWLVNMAMPFFKYSFVQVMKSLSNTDTYMSDVTLGRSIIGETLDETIVFNVRLFFIILNFVLTIIAIYIYVKEKKTRKLYDIVIFWIISVFLLLFIAYGGEIILRIYLYSLIGTIFFITHILMKSNRSVVIFSIILLLAIFNTIAFAGDKTFKIVSNSEIAGDNFFVRTTHGDADVFYTGGSLILKYLDLSSNRHAYGFWAPPNEKQFNSTIEYGYIIRSEIGTNLVNYYLNHDPIFESIEEINQKYYKIYDNEKFITFKQK